MMFDLQPSYFNLVADPLHITLQTGNHMQTLGFSAEMLHADSLIVSAALEIPDISNKLENVSRLCSEGIACSRQMLKTFSNRIREMSI